MDREYEVMDIESQVINYQKKYINDKLNYFNNLQIYLMTFGSFVLSDKKLSEWELPISNEELKETGRRVKSAYSKCKVFYYEEEVEEIYKEMAFGDTLPSRIKEIPVENPRTLLELFGLCDKLCEFYQIIIHRGSYANFINNDNIEKLGTGIIEKAYEMIGYWTARAEMSKSSMPGVLKKKADKELKKVKLQNIRKKYPHLEADPVQKIAFYADAMKETGLTSTRRINDLLKELNLKKEKSA